jgi:hypothetical protein
VSSKKYARLSEQLAAPVFVLAGRRGDGVMLPQVIIRQHRKSRTGAFSGFYWANNPVPLRSGRCCDARTDVGTAVVNGKAEVSMSILVNPMFWDKKIKLAVLTFATFAALC